MSRSVSEQDVAEATAEIEKVRKDWMRRPGVTALDVGYKIKRGQLTTDLAVRVHVKRKLPKEALAPHDVFPERLGRFKVDVIEAEYGPQSA